MTYTEFISDFVWNNGASGYQVKEIYHDGQNTEAVIVIFSPIQSISSISALIPQLQIDLLQFTGYDFTVSVMENQ